MAIRIYLSPMYEETLVDGSQAIGCYLDKAWPVLGGSRVTMRVNQKWCLVAVDTSYEDSAMKDDANLRSVFWGSSDVVSENTRTLLNDKLGVTVPSGITMKELFQKLIKRVSPRFDQTILKEKMAANRLVWIDLVTSEMDV